MARRTGRAALTLSNEHRAMLNELAGSRTSPAREVERARVLLAYADGQSPPQIQRALGTSRPTIYKCIDKALAAGRGDGVAGSLPPTVRTANHR
jgi:DNA invertase Pin-like site-specific DNA recombinase